MVNRFGVSDKEKTVIVMRWLILHFGIALRYLFYVTLFLVTLLNFGWEGGLPKGILYAFFFILGLYAGAWFAEVCRKYVRGVDKGGGMERVLKKVARHIKWVWGGLFVAGTGCVLLCWKFGDVAKEWWYLPFFTGGLFAGACVYSYCVNYINRDWRKNMMRMREYDDK